MHAILQYESGIAFVAAVHKRLQYRFAGWTDCLSRSFDRILTCPPGYRLFQTITGDIPPSSLTPLVHYVIDRLFVDADRELITLVCALLRMIADSHVEYERLLSLPIYLARPALADLAVTLLEWGEGPAVAAFQEEIVNNVNGLLAGAGLVEVLVAFVAFADRDRRDRVIVQLTPRYQELIQYPWTWRLIYTIMNAATMRQRMALMMQIVTIVKLQLLPPSAEEMLLRSLDSVDAKSRIAFWTEMGNVVGSYAKCPQLCDYMCKLPVVLSAHNDA
jgi:hypothetical protein